MPDIERISVEDAVRIGITLHKEGRIDEAREMYAEILDAAPGQPDAMHYLGVLNHQTGASEEGAELIRQAIKLAPGDASIRSNYGNVLQQLGRLEEAEEAYRQTLQLDPALVEAHCNLGVVLRRQKKTDEAEAALLNALSLDPEHADSHQNLGNIYKSRKDFDRAIEHYRSASQYCTGAAANRLGLTLADTLRRAGRSEESVVVLRECAARDPEEPIARHLLAALTGENVPARASDAYLRKTFDSFAPTFDEVLQRLHYRAPRLVAERLDALLDGVPSPRDVLDAGCGTGLSGELLKPHAGRLVGVDLSSVMLQEARAKHIYDELVEAEITAYLEANSCAFDVIACVDAFVYFGALDEVLVAAHGALRPGGWMCFTVEKTHATAGVEGGYEIAGHGRYQHAVAYIEDVMSSNGFTSTETRDVILRLEMGQAVGGLLVSGRRTSA